MARAHLLGCAYTLHSVVLAVTNHTVIHMTPKTKMGRPRRAKKASEKRLVARVSEAEYAAAEHAARRQGAALSDFIREAVAARVEFYAAVFGSTLIAQVKR